MKKVIIIFAGVAMALIGCKTQTDGLASAGVDDVYYNPKKDRAPNVAPQPEQYAAKPADPNAGKIAATAADENNPYYKDPSFNYDDYYDNAYAARIRRFNNPIYGTGYYDTYNTNSYFYNGNPSCYGTSIYSSYNVGYGYNNGWGGYYSPSATFWNSYYNPYYNSYYYNNGWPGGWSMGYGYNPYNSYGMGGYGGWGYGYNPYGMGYSGYGYNPYGYGSPMTYYNPYDYNSNSYSHYGPRGSHSGGNSTTTSPVPKPHDLLIDKPQIVDNSAATPYSTGRFNQVPLPKDHFTKLNAVKSPVSTASPLVTRPGDGKPAYNDNSGGSYSNGNVNTGRPSYNPSNAGYSAPANTNNSNSGSPNTGETRPRKWVIGGGGDNNTGGSGSSSGGSGGGINWNTGGSGVGTKGGSNPNSGGNSGGGISRPRK